MVGEIFVLSYPSVICYEVELKFVCFRIFCHGNHESVHQCINKNSMSLHHGTVFDCDKTNLVNEK